MSKTRRALNRKRLMFKYEIKLTWNEDAQCWVVTSPELEGFEASAVSLSEVEAASHAAIESYVRELSRKGLPIPPPMAEKNFTGQHPLRIESKVHRNAWVKATSLGLSLNKYIEGLLKKDGC